MSLSTTEVKKLIIVPLVIITSLLLFGLGYRALGLPEADEFLRIARDYYHQYGYWVVFLAAIAEGLLLLNWYLPGSAVVVLGVVFARENGQNVGLVILLIALAFLITSVINYLFGRYGWYQIFLRFGLKKPLEEARKRVEDKGLPIIFTSYFHPNIGALTATSAGIIQADFKKFFLYSAIAWLVWGAIWGTIVYFFGPQLLQFGTIQIMTLILAVWFIYTLVHFFYQRKKVQAREDSRV